MFANPAKKRKMEILRSYGNEIIEPLSEELASHLIGKGRMEEPENIFAFMQKLFEEENLLSKKKIIITAGPTYERIDPVRFIGNYSSGKMGFALAEECGRRGADVTLIAGPVALEIHHPNIKRIDVESAEQMFNVAVGEFEDADMAILCAAVAGYKPAIQAKEKMKRV